MRSLDVRIDSDREALPFPVGGVHGSTAENRDVTSEVIANLDRVQNKLNQLATELDDCAEADLRAVRSVIGRISSAAQGSFPPAAA